LSPDYFPKKKTQPVKPVIAAELVEGPLEEVQLGEVQVAEKQLTRATGEKKESWLLASRTVRDYKPVSGYLWRIVHAVLGRQDRLGKADPMIFDALKPLIFEAAADPRLGDPKTKVTSLDTAVGVVGIDSAAAVCVVYGVCRRISATLSERLWRPIIDDALIRASIGYLIGAKATEFGKGRGVLAGFAGRAGLAIQIAASDIQKAQRALEGLASGQPMKDVGTTVYGCDPLQVSAIMLASAGVTVEAAYGVAAYSNQGKDILPKSAANLWLSVFTIAENLRVASVDKIEPKYWRALGIEESAQREIISEVDALLRKGHNWQWMLSSQEHLVQAQSKKPN